MSLRNIRNSYDTRSTNHQGNLFLVAFSFFTALLGLFFGLMEDGVGQTVCFAVAAVAAALGLILGLVWLNAKDVYFSENPEEFVREPAKIAADAIKRAKSTAGTPSE